LCKKAEKFYRGDSFVGDVLTQEQIDILLGRVSGGGSSEPSVKEDEGSKHRPYDFKSPQKFTREDVKVIHDVFDVYSRLVSSYLTGETRLYCQVKVMSVEEQRYFEFSNALEDYTMMGTINIQVNEEDIDDTVCMIQFSNAVTFSIIDRLLGGPGTHMDISRDFSEIEVAIIKRVMTKMTGLLKEAWNENIDVMPVLDSIETNSRINKSISADEIIVLITLELEINNAKNIITVTIPAVSMAEMLGHFSNRSRRKMKHYDPNKDLELRRSLLNRVSQSNLKLNAILSNTQLDLGDLLLLQPNDIIPLDMAIDQNVSVVINNAPFYEAKMGVLNNHKALRIVGLNKQQMR